MRALSCFLFLLAILQARNSLAEDTKSQDQNQDEGEAVERIRRQIGGYFGAGLDVYGNRELLPNGYPYPYDLGPYIQDRRVIGGGFGGAGFYGR